MLVTTLGKLLAAEYAIAILFGFYCYVFMYGFSALPIPTVSETWLFKPANFVSRQLVISGSVGLVVLHFSIHLAVRQSRPDVSPTASLLLLIVALSSSFCLGVIGGVCMGDDTPECLSSVKWHDDFAVAYFLLEDCWMFGMQVLFMPAAASQTKVASTSSASNTFRWCLVFTSVCCNLAMVMPKEDGGALLVNLPLSTGTVEWANTLMVFLFILSFCNDFLPNAHIGQLNTASTTTSSVVTVLGQLTNSALTAGMLLVFAASMCAGFVLFPPFPTAAVALGSFYLPSVSDLYVLPPGNSIGRLSGVLGACLGYVIMLQFYHVYRQSPRFQHHARRAKAMCLVSVLSLVCLSLTSCISTVEDALLHLTVASFFFGLFQLYMLATATTPTTGALALASLSVKVRLIVGLLDMRVYNVLELVDLVSMAGFVAVFAWENSSALDQHPLVLYIAAAVPPVVVQEI